MASAWASGSKPFSRETRAPLRPAPRASCPGWSRAPRRPPTRRPQRHGEAGPRSAPRRPVACIPTIRRFFALIQVEAGLLPAQQIGAEAVAVLPGWRSHQVAARPRPARCAASAPLLPPDGNVRAVDDPPPARKARREIGATVSGTLRRPPSPTASRASRRSGPRSGRAGRRSRRRSGDMHWSADRRSDQHAERPPQPDACAKSQHPAPGSRSHVSSRTTICDLGLA